MFTQPISSRVNPGTVVDSVIIITGTQLNGNINYQAGFPAFPFAGFSVFNSPKLTRALIGLEAANVVGPLDYPTAGTTQFSQITIDLLGPPIRFPTVQWSHVDDVADRITTTINTDGVPFGVITIKYPPLI
jgi:hypothetical protein